MNMYVYLLPIYKRMSGYFFANAVECYYIIDFL